MSSSIEIDGFDELENMLQNMTISEEDEKKAMKKAIEVIAAEVEKNTPKRTGKLKKSIKKTVKKEELDTVGIVNLGKFYDIFQEFGTSQQKTHVGFFERSINKSEDDAIRALSDELLK